MHHPCRLQRESAKFHVLSRRGTQTTIFFFFSWTLVQSFRIQLQEKFANIWQIKWDWISAIKFEAAPIHFLREVFDAVAVVVAWARKEVCGKNSGSRWSLAWVFAIMIIWKGNLCIVWNKERYNQRTKTDLSLSTEQKLTAPPLICKASSEKQQPHGEEIWRKVGYLMRFRCCLCVQFYYA